MTLKSYSKFAAQKFDEVDKIMESKIPKLQARMVELLEKPIQRNDYLLDFFIDDGYASMAEGSGINLAKVYWEQVNSLVALSWHDLHLIPINERDAVFDSARETIMACAQEQSFIEIVGKQIMTKGLEMGAERLRTTRGVDTEKIKKATNDIKKELKKIKNGEQKRSKSRD